MSSSIRHRFVQVLSSLSLALPLLVGCGSPDVHPTVILTDHSTKALSLGSFMEINGAYGTGCTNRTGSWSVGIGGFTGLTNPALSVIRNDLGCSLSASSVRIGSGLSGQLYSPAAALALGASFASSGSAFNQMMSDPVAFYGNLRIQPDLSFANDFILGMVYSEDPNLVSASQLADYAVQSATATADGVSAPDYSVDVTGLSMQVDVNKIVQTTGGNAVLTAGTIAGQSFVVSSNDLGASPSMPRWMPSSKRERQPVCRDRARRLRR